jgi:hypothetical protein
MVALRDIVMCPAESDTNTVAQDEVGPNQAQDKGRAAANEREGREVLTPSNFIVMAATVVAAVSALLVARFTTLST